MTCREVSRASLFVKIPMKKLPKQMVKLLPKLGKITHATGIGWPSGYRRLHERLTCHDGGDFGATTFGIPRLAKRKLLASSSDLRRLSAFELRLATFHRAAHGFGLVG